ncbi:MAG: hypothetical protein QG657_1534 [Acidobacteriota bacterium]|nr:hypothetical protein [Acidobacteriota bacterium]
MGKKLLAIFVLTVFSLLSFSCYTQKMIRVDEMTSHRGQILAVVTNSGDWIEFDTPRKIVNDEIIYLKNEGGVKKVSSIRLSEVQRVWLRKSSVSEFFRKMYVGIGIFSIITVFGILLGA